MNRKHCVAALAGAVLLGHLLLTSFRQGWSHVETDFPNYYTAAVLTLRRQPLRSFYDWTWFQRQMNYTGTERQLGGYTPHTPLTMIPLLPLAGLEPQRAKQVWLVLGLLCLGGSIGILSRLTGFPVAEVFLVAMLAQGALRGNFVLGQYYLILLFLLTCSAWCLLRGRPFAGGALIGLIFALKLYTAPFLFYFALRRQWSAFWGMVSSVAVLAAAAVTIHGFDGVWFFATTVMPRAFDGSVNDPYNPGWGSMTAFLRHTFVPEAELNPHPLAAMPGLFFFLHAFYTLGVLAFSLLALREDRGPRVAEVPRAGEASRANLSDAHGFNFVHGFGWFVIVLFALSPNTASYHFILLLVPVVLFLRREAPVRRSILWPAGLICLYLLVEMPLFPWDARLFPKAWLLLGLLCYSGWRRFASIRPRAATAVLAVLIAVSAAEAWRRSIAYQREPPGMADRGLASHAVIDPDGIYSSAPAVGSETTVYESLAEERYLLRAARLGTTSGAGVQTFAFDGEALHPSLARAGGRIYFELVAGGHSRICSFDPLTRQLQSLVGPEFDPVEPAISGDGATLAFVSRGSIYVRKGATTSVVFRSRTAAGPAFFPDGQRIAIADGPPGRRSIRAVPLSGGEAQTLTEGGDCFAPAISPDGTLLAYARSETGGRQVWIRDLSSGAARQVTQGGCSNDSPAWQSDSRSIVFASDCRRGLGLPALYTVGIR